MNLGDGVAKGIGMGMRGWSWKTAFLADEEGQQERDAGKESGQRASEGL
jgi:hypothetical protein